MTALAVVADRDWRALVLERTSAAYAKLGILPRAFYEPTDDTIYVQSKAAGNRRLLAHEFGHAVRWPGSDHPTTIVGGFLHAVRVRFDVRAFSGLLRWRSSPPALLREFDAWHRMVMA